MKKTWFKRKKDTAEVIDNSIEKEQKKINWFKKKEKNIEDSFDSLEPQKEKKTINFNKLFRKTKNKE